MKKNVLNQALMLFLALSLCSSCATIVSKSAYYLSVATNPAGANVSVVDKKGVEIFKGQTPATVKLKPGAGYFSKAQYQVKLSAPGYNEQIIPVNFKINGWYFGNILLGGVLGMLVIDPATGAMWRLDTPPISVTLSHSTAFVGEPSLEIININDVPENMKGHLVRLR